jgi:hypothetical protein
MATKPRARKKLDEREQARLYLLGKAANRRWRPRAEILAEIVFQSGHPLRSVLRVLRDGRRKGRAARDWVGFDVGITLITNGIAVPGDFPRD